MYYAGIGSRKTPAQILFTMTKIARTFAQHGWILRSGGAAGADTAFSNGAGELAHIYLPWHGFGTPTSGRAFIYSSDAMEFAKQFHPTWSRLSWTAKKLMARNTHQILGHDALGRSSIVICWTPDGAETLTTRETGGTGQAIRMAVHYNVPVFNLKRPGRLDDLRRWYKKQPKR
jgi:hypothetical protein